MNPHDIRIRFLHILADVWGKIYLFQPSVVRRDQPLDWEQVLLAAIPAVERLSRVEDLVACLNAMLFHPLSDPYSYAQCGQVSADKQYPEHDRAGQPGISLRRVHEGWNEDGRPYIYCQKWERVSDRPHHTHYTLAYPEGLSIHLHTALALPGDVVPPLGFTRRAQSLRAGQSLTRAERLLGLFKTWAILSYFFPLVNERTGMPEWDELLSAWIPPIEAAQDLATFYRQMQALAATLHDGHATAWHAVLSRQAAPGQAAAPRPRIPFPVPEAVRHIRKLSDTIAYMNPFSMPDTQTLYEAFAIIQQTEGLILDLRGYPRTHFQQALMRCLCREPVVSPHYNIPCVFHPERQNWQWKHVQYTVDPDSSRPVYAGPVVALIHAGTQSSAEDLGMYLRIAKRAVFVGTATPGCHGNAAYIDLPGGGWFAFSGMRVTWPDGQPFQGIGIMPDIMVQPVPLETGRDPILQAGIEILTTLVNQQRQKGVEQADATGRVH